MSGMDVGGASPVLVDPSRLIDWFDDFAGAQPYRYLSNFFDPRSVRHWDEPRMYEVHLDGYGILQSWTTEAIFAAAKTHPADLELRNRILAAEPGRAKMLGRRCNLRPDWEEVKLFVMEQCLRAKFANHRPEANLLLNTGTADLVEGTLWNDRIWGVDLSSVTREGQNLLGALLMAQRARLRYERNRNR